MHSELIEVMRAQVSTIYRVLTGTAMPELQASSAEPAAPFETVARSFAELEALARTLPLVAERLPPFSFAPPLDALRQRDELVIEVAVPGVERDDVTVEYADATLIIFGIRRASRGAEPGTYSRGEIPWGPFYRSVHIPFSVHGEPSVDLDRGMLRVRLKSSPDQQQ